MRLVLGSFEYASKEMNTPRNHLCTSLDLPQHVPLNVVSLLFKEVARLILFPADNEGAQDEVHGRSLEDNIESANSFADKSDDIDISEPNGFSWLWRGDESDHTNNNGQDSSSNKSRSE